MAADEGDADGPPTTNREDRVVIKGDILALTLAPLADENQNAPRISAAVTGKIDVQYVVVGRESVAA